MQVSSQVAVKFYNIEVNYDEIITEAIRSVHSLFASSKIRDGDFPSKEKGVRSIEFVVLSFKKDMTTAQAEKGIKQFGLRPATLKELLAFSRFYVQGKNQPWVVALGSVWTCSCPHGPHFGSPYIKRKFNFPYSGGESFYLDVASRLQGWHRCWDFTAVRDG